MHQHSPAPDRRDERGATAVEYGLMVAFIALAIVTTVQAFGQTIANGFQPVIDTLTSII
jgi:pilus assembly protein Flp/PilA